MASIVVVLLVSIAGYKRITAPSTYEECVLRHISEAQNNQAAALVHAACRSQFPIKGEFDDIFGITKK